MKVLIHAELPQYPDKCYDLNIRQARAFRELQVIKIQLCVIGFWSAASPPVP